ncbi:MAG: sulfite exporter TauE/SafE family protein [Bacillota bacterium]
MFEIIPASAVALAHVASAAPGAMSAAATAAGASSTTAWWVWPVLLFVSTFIIGILAVLGGVGGGVLYTPIIGGFFPFGMDFVRSAGLIVALSGALAAGPGLLKRNLASLRLAIPVALIASTCSIFGAMVGLKAPDSITKTCLGITIILIALLFLLSKSSEFPKIPGADALSKALQMNGIYHEASTGKTIDWAVHRTPLGLFLFIFIGFMAGMFGLGAGWANVPVLNLLMGAPLKISVATSKFLLSITDTSAAWVYLNSGACLPLIVVPSVIGIMLGSLVGVRVLAVTKPKAVRWVVIIMLFVAGVKPLYDGIKLLGS